MSPPSKKFASLTLPYAEIDAADLLRISNFESGEPFFGKSKKNRFDDRRKLSKAKRFGTCYTGFSLNCAFAETVLHNRTAVGGEFLLPVEELERWVVTFEPAPLAIAVLIGPELKTMGADGSISTISPYVLPGQWSAAVHEHPANVDGLAYMSKHCNDQLAVVLFDRAKPKLAVADYVPLVDYPGALRTYLDFHVRIKY
ncbi:hypothetical protein AS149_25290 [Burkholderia cenocepacia]|nr:hypothetical protein AS149_25290 [Burkholderia cenocepacia]